MDFILYTSILSRLVRCQDEQDEKVLMFILSATKHTAHSIFVWTFYWSRAELSSVKAFFRNLTLKERKVQVSTFPVKINFSYLSKVSTFPVKSAGIYLSLHVKINFS